MYSMYYDILKQRAKIKFYDYPSMFIIETIFIEYYHINRLEK